MKSLPESFQSTITLLNLTSDDILYLTGSRAEGFSLPGSDLDLVLISDRQINQPLPSEVELLTPTSLLELRNKVASLSGPGLRRMDFWDVVTCHRLLIGEPLVHPEGFRRVWSDFPWPVLYRYLITDYLRGVRFYLQDARKAMEAGEGIAAKLCARDSLECAMDAVLVSRGEWNPKRKWRWAKVRRAFGESPVANQFLSLVMSSAELEPGMYVKACEDLILELGEEARIALERPVAFPLTMARGGRHESIHSGTAL